MKIIKKITIFGLIQAQLFYGITVEQAYFDLATALQAEGDSAQAIVHYKNTLQRNPRHSSALFNLGYELYKQKNYEEAIEYITQNINLNPLNVHAHELIALSYSALADYENAITHYKIALNIHPCEKLHLA